jgi:UDP-N-acetyl-D-mannosaminuronic acid dehydrogenase
VSKGSKSKHDVCIAGGAGHIGLPLALVLAHSDFHTLILDISKAAMEIMASGQLPFPEESGLTLLKNVLASGRLHFSSDPKDAAHATFVVVTIGTPIDEFHNSNLSLLTRCLDELMPYPGDDQTLILRSTVASGTTGCIERYLRAHGKRTSLAFCPERVVQGKGVAEIRALPQLVSGTSAAAVANAKNLFARSATATQNDRFSFSGNAPRQIKRKSIAVSRNVNQHSARLSHVKTNDSAAKHNRGMTIKCSL